MNAPRIVIATNNGELGGGEVMLLNIAGALRAIGLEVAVLGPEAPGDVLREASSRGLRTIAVPARGRRSYMAALRLWRVRHPRELLWCNGLVPSLATAGIGPRLVHLHQLPVGPQRRAVEPARFGATAVLVPSHTVAERVRGARVLENWTEEISLLPASTFRVVGPLRVGYLGRLTRGKGVDVLAGALQRVVDRHEGGARLVLAGENRFGSREDDAQISRALEGLGPDVEHAGWVERTELFRRIDVLAVPSVSPESFGLVAAEAMAAGVPVVVSDAGALPEVVGPGHPWIVPRGDVEALADALLAVASSPSERREGATRQARARWEQEFSPWAGTRRLADLLMTFGATRNAPTHPTTLRSAVV